MKLRNLLLTVGSCCYLTITAQSVMGDLPKRDIQRLQPIKIDMPVKVGTAPICKSAEKIQTRLNQATAEMERGEFSQLIASAKRMLASTEKKERLDSLVFTNPDGSKSQRMYCIYDNRGLMIKQINSLWNAGTEQWDTVQEFNYEWNESGYCLMQSNYAYGSGERFEYKYNERNLGIEQIIYVAGEDGVWQEYSKGEYGYDEAGNMIDERTFVWSDGKWMEAVHSTATYDEQNRMTAIETYEKQGEQWVGSVKQEYDNFSDDKLNYKYMYRWIPETESWRNAQRFIQDWREDGLLLAQRMRFWNEDRQDWTGEYSSWGTGEFNLSYDAIMEYDNRDRITLQSHREWHNAGEDIFPVSEMITVWTDNADGTYDSEMNAYLIDYDTKAQTWNQRQYNRYNAQGLLIWDLQQLQDLYATDMISDYETKYEYDERGNQIYEATWNFEDGVRVPSLEERASYDENNNITEQYFRMASNGGGNIPLGAPVRQAPGHEDADDEGWQNSSHFTYRYENGIRIEKMNWRWDTSLNDWIPSQGTTVHYDYGTPASEIILPLTWEDPYKIESTDEYTGNSNGDWDISHRYYYYSEHEYSGITQQVANNVIFADNILKIIGGSEIDNRVYDLTGKQVYQGNNSEENLSRLNKGIYVVKSIIDNETHTLKIIIR